MVQTHTAEYDALVIGAGFGGLYMLKKLRDDLKLNVHGIEKAAGVGGTWWHNRYPGARSDSESYVYIYTFDQELMQSWEWKEKYLRQPEILSYLEHVAERYKLKELIDFNTEFTGCAWDEDKKIWTVDCKDGKVYTAKYLVTAIGVLSQINWPAIPGREKFKGDLYHTGAYPANVDLTNKVVGLIGTGSTGVQIVAEIGPIVKELTVFQRRPQYTVPAKHHALDEAHQKRVKQLYKEGFAEMNKGRAMAMGFPDPTVPAMSVSEEERRRVFQDAWDWASGYGGGIYFQLGTFSDIITDYNANEAAAQFIRDKIREIVKDPKTAEMLTPHDLYARRPLCDAGYYQQFNRPNVHLVDVSSKGTPIKEITEEGVVTADGKLHKLEVLICATGFDASDGNYVTRNIRGKNGVRVQDHWKDGAGSAYGIHINDFPNLFMILGPGCAFANIPPVIETQVEYIADCIAEAEKRGTTVDCELSTEKGWTEYISTISDMTLYSKQESWIFGVNIPGKRYSTLFFMGGSGAYKQYLDKVREEGFRGVVFA
ncbi:cyclohexanone monooxygenase [Hyaloraphidium curvatum]|nr:cyclohexanone monooxygenase [Hyaloraphidium curvatum]